jgi:hypothetical protein
MARHREKNTDSGVSESIGFILIFGIIISGIGLVTLYGYPMLLQQQTSADEKIMEKNMIVLQNDIKSLAYKTVPFKETSLKIGGGPLTVYNSSSAPSATFTIDDSVGSCLPDPYGAGGTFTPGELRYESIKAQTDISLQNGAVVQRPTNVPGSTMLAQPRWFFDASTNIMVINLIEVTSSSILSKEGIGTVQMELVGDPYYKETTVPLHQSITLEYTPVAAQDYSIAWDNYIWNTWEVPQSYKARIGTRYTLTNEDPLSRDMTLVVKIFKVNIRTI